MFEIVVLLEVGVRRVGVENLNRQCGLRVQSGSEVLHDVVVGFCPVELGSLHAFVDEVRRKFRAEVPTGTLEVFLISGEFGAESGFWRCPFDLRGRACVAYLLEVELFFGGEGRVQINYRRCGLRSIISNSGERVRH